MEMTSTVKPCTKRPRRMAREPKANASQPTFAAAISTPASNGSTEPRQSKAALVLLLLARPEGVSLAELVEATGWLPHTTRAALTGLRKKGHAITKCKAEEFTCYRIDAGDAA